jgi:hypothetical protein
MAQIRKAITAGLTTGAGVYAALQAANFGDELVRVGAAVGAALVAGLVVYLIPNAPPGLPAKP